MKPASAGRPLSHCRVCGWSRDTGDICAQCGDWLTLTGAPSRGDVVAVTSLAGTSFAAVSLGPEITVLAIGEPALPGQRVELRPRADGTLEAIG
jgi:hypothetical protein